MDWFLNEDEKVKIIKNQVFDFASLVKIMV